MVALLVLGPWLLPEYRDPNAGKLDLWSVTLSLAAVLPTIYGLKHMAEQGLSMIGATAIVIGVSTGTLFVRRQGRLAYPLLDLSLFRNARFSAAIAAYALSCLAMFGVYIFITQYLQLVLGLTPLRAGLATLPWGLAFIAGSLLAPMLSRRVPALTVLVGGLVAAAFGFGLLMLTDGPWGLATLIAATVVMSLGLAPVFTLGNEMIITAAPLERAGLASAVSETSSEFSGALGIAVFGSIGAVLYRGELQAAIPEGVPSDLAAQALATLGGALTASQSLAPPLGAALAVAARASFVDALQVAAIAGALILLAASAIAARILRNGVNLSASDQTDAPAARGG